MDFWRFWWFTSGRGFLELFTTIMVAYIYVLRAWFVPPQPPASSISTSSSIPRRRDRHDAPSLLQRRACDSHGDGGRLLRHGSDPAGAPDFEAWRFMRLGAQSAQARSSTPQRDFPHKWAVMFLIAVASGTSWAPGVRFPHQPAHRELLRDRHRLHGQSRPRGADGRYGMLAIGFFMFIARHFIRPDRGSERAMKLSFWA